MKKTISKKKYPKLYELRTKNNYSCKDMAKKLNMCTAFYWQIENGKRGLYYPMAKKYPKFSI